MKTFISLLLSTTLILSLTACKEQKPPKEETDAPPVSSIPEVKDNIDFHNQAKKMTVEEAKTYLAKEELDQTSVQYKEAVYTVHQAVAQECIAVSKEKNQVTDRTRTLFEGIRFKFIEGEGYTSQTVKTKLILWGNYQKETDGWYRYVFFDRTLAQSASNPDNDYCLNEYTNVLELLLSDPNVIVEPIE